MENKDIIPLSLPLLDYINNLYSLERNRPFSAYKILAVQHLLGSTVPFFSMLEKGGAKPKNIYIVGKAYSSHPEVVKLLIHKGYRLNFHDVFEYEQNEPYDSILEKHIIRTCNNLLHEINNDEKGLIIDDGGKAIRLLHNKYPKLAKRFACVEQTSRGARIVNSLDLICPTINVARSDAKTLYESPAIAKGMMDEFIKLINIWNIEEVFTLVSKKTLLLGYGFIGEKVAYNLQKLGFDVTVYDSNETQLKKAELSGLSITRKIDNLNHIHIIIGCTGNSILKNNDFDMLSPGTLLVNMASTDIEFSAWQLRPKGKIIHQQTLLCDIKFLKKYMPLPWRSLYKIHLASTYIYLVNGGFPLDFSGKINPIPLANIQLTSSLLLGGAIQAVNTKKPGFISVDSKLQESLIDIYIKELSHYD